MIAGRQTLAVEGKNLKNTRFELDDLGLAEVDRAAMRGGCRDIAAGPAMAPKALAWKAMALPKLRKIQWGRSYVVYVQMSSRCRDGDYRNFEKSRDFGVGTLAWRQCGVTRAANPPPHDASRNVASRLVALQAGPARSVPDSTGQKTPISGAYCTFLASAPMDSAPGICFCRTNRS